MTPVPCALTNMAYGNAHAHKPEALLFGPTKIFLNLDWETNGRGPQMIDPKMIENGLPSPNLWCLS